VTPERSHHAAAVPPVAIVISRYNLSVTGPMLEAAIAAYRDRGGSEANLGVIDAPGSFDLTAIAAAAASSPLYAGVLAIGCIIKGETEHDRHIAAAVAQGLTQISVRTGKPVAFGVLTVNTAEQASARAGGNHGNKGSDTMHALLDAVAAVDAIRTATGPALRVNLAHAPPDKPASNP
jgi:6,7-dimethyl-8-ribityllumazine synthase